jgi:hypothetical protein
MKDFLSGAYIETQHISVRQIPRGEDTTSAISANMKVFRAIAAKKHPVEKGENGLHHKTLTVDL